MLALPVYRAMACVAVADARARPFAVRETTQVTPSNPRLLDRVREAIRACFFDPNGKARLAPRQEARWHATT